MPSSPTIADAVHDIDFPILKEDLLRESEGRTVALGSDAVDLADLVARIDADYFESEEDLVSAMTDVFGPIAMGEGESMKFSRTGMDVLEDAFEEMP
jgi:hypothetical protein